MGNSPARPSQESADTLRSEVDESCVKAAQLITEADVLLLATGAGFSADSGLAVYQDIAKVDAYAKRDLKYHDICVPSWLADEPALFWGFWGRCFNDYRETRPHCGYDIIKKWRDQLFSATDIATRLRAEQQAKDELDESTVAEAYEVDAGAAAGAFFNFTSNVDAHSFDVFDAHEIRECHGNTELFQCAEPCCDRIWRAPADFTFIVDPKTILAPDTISASREEEEEVKTTSEGAAAVIGATTGARRLASERLKNMPPPLVDARSCFERNHPTCIACGAPARPAILMFNDCDWHDSASQKKRYKDWVAAVRGLDSPLKVVVVEVGAGANVTTVRRESENVFHSRKKQHATTVIRINPEFPFGDEDPEFLTEGNVTVLPIMSRGLEAIKKIDSVIDLILLKKKEHGRHGGGAPPPQAPPLDSDDDR